MIKKGSALYFELEGKKTCNTLHTLCLASWNYKYHSDAAFTLILLDMWSRWWRGGDCYGQRRLHGWFLLSGRCLSVQACFISSICILFYTCMNVCEYLHFCHLHAFEINSVRVCVCFRLRTSGTALIKLMKMCLKSKSFTRSSCLLPHQIRVRYLNTTCFSSRTCYFFYFFTNVFTSPYSLRITSRVLLLYKVYFLAFFVSQIELHQTSEKRNSKKKKKPQTVFT